MQTRRNDPDATKSKTVACATCHEDRYIPASVAEPYICARCRAADIKAKAKGA